MSSGLAGFDGGLERHQKNLAREMGDVGPRMKAASTDIALGVGVVLLIALVAYSAGGVGGVLHVAILWAGAGLALFLWKKESRAANVLAVILAPAILLTYLLPRKLRRAIQSLEQTKP